MTKSKDPQSVVENQTKELIAKMHVDAQVSVIAQDENYKVQIDTPDTGLLIGYHGEVINSLQLILGVLVYRELGEWVRIIVDVGDYRQKREETIKRLALDKAEEAVSTGQPVSLPYLSPLERRIVHLTLSENPRVTSESEGEGKDRHIVIKPQK
ncbi:hypothetical protein A2773_05440 [Candidatus Gottesmanbacteria bacterium RIFCSPHIGHO2_01_FULL_39_10]|uniref:R3H domain-containing protein n=1 Tax=Candidatus Gottesmanbacteria bacterium RIFCSPHIGHO2_01_FULL_39_10 TaxID=1798375 RepID=A0A1F5ZQ89_9BACT|nr:MAG: hypothetical protein A2773_05440 [Candidatus Gottesmanbacteria bacterium RIFCSPHIGHO2_01_FULL_39_10]